MTWTRRFIQRLRGLWPLLKRIWEGAPSRPPAEDGYVRASFICSVEGSKFVLRELRLMNSAGRWISLSPEVAARATKLGWVLSGTPMYFPERGQLEIPFTSQGYVDA